MAEDTALETILGHSFDDPNLLLTALTHPSVAGQNNYQRLEFLGDRILGATIADQLFQHYPDMNEGDLALRYNDLVRRETLAAVAINMGLAAHIHLSKGEDESGGREKPAILADVVEALIAALYLDGGLACARRFVEQYWQDLISLARTTEKDGKTALQEWAQSKGMGTPDYREISRTGPSHAPTFMIEVSLVDGMSATGEAGSKREAEQEAAASMLAVIKEEQE